MPMNNEERAEHAVFACDAYSNSKEGNPSYDEPSTIAADLICDLLHMIRAHGDEPSRKLRTAITNFVAEELDEDGACLDPDIAPFIESLRDNKPKEPCARPYCRYCGSDNLGIEATAYYDDTTQQIEVGDVYEKGHYCTHCDGETRLEWRTPEENEVFKQSDECENPAPAEEE